jgi:hypothetical protein
MFAEIFVPLFRRGGAAPKSKRVRGCLRSRGLLRSDHGCGAHGAAHRDQRLTSVVLPHCSGNRGLFQTPIRPEVGNEGLDVRQLTERRWVDPVALERPTHENYPLVVPRR